MDKETWIFLFIAWLVAGVATLGSLFFSEIMGFPPCSLCWYQRICMYPLVLILGMGLFSGEPKAVQFGLPFVGLGILFAGYHNLVHYKVIPENLAPCSMGVPCATSYINWLGFINIPLLSLIAFVVILFLLLRLNRNLR